MELLRALGAVIGPPDPTIVRVAAMLDLPAAPSPAEYAFLFQSQLRPLASIYLSASGEPGGEPRDRIAGYWRAVGRAAPAQPDELGQMLSLYADLVEQEDRESDPARRHAVARIRKAFLWEQLLTWVPAYVTKVDLIGPRPYRRWAQLVEQIVAREAWRAGAVPSVSLTLQRLQDLSDPPTGDLGALITYLTAPARSGLVLAPVDLERAADEMHVATPTGGVRSALQTLVAIRSNALFNWVAAEARRWELRHERNRDVLPTLSDHWIRRARATRTLLLAWMRGAETRAPAEPAERAGPSTEPPRAVGRPRGDPRRAPKSHRHP